MSKAIEYAVTEPDGTERQMRFKGRDAWAQDELIRAAEKGCTPPTHPGPRWSGYIYRLRRAGLDIATLHEAHDGPYAGHHGRYILRSRVRRAHAAAVEAGWCGDGA